MLFRSPDSIIFWYSHRLDPFSVLVGTVFRYSQIFCIFPVQTRILQFIDTHIDTTLYGYSPGQFFDTRTDSTFSRYSTGFYHLSVLTQIRPFFGTGRDSFSSLERILPFPGTRPDYIIFRYSHRFAPFRVLAGTVFRYSYRFYLFRVFP